MTHEILSPAPGEVQATTLPLKTYSRLGGKRGPMFVPLERVTTLLVSDVGAGKTSILQSHPGCFLFNLDNNGTVIDNAVGLSWPAVNQMGQAVDDAGRPFVPTYEHLRQKIDILCDMATKNEDRPTTVAFDSMTKLVAMLRGWGSSHAKQLGIISNDSQPEVLIPWHDLPPMRAYGWLYDTIILDIHDRLRAHGYGVVFTAQFVRKFVKAAGQTDPNAMVPTMILAGMASGLYERLMPAADLVIAIEKQTEAVSGFRDIQMGAKTVKQPTNTVVEYRTASTTITESFYKFHGFKQRVGFDAPIRLPKEGGWDALSSKWKEIFHQNLPAQPA